jgi:hypothetical protein
MTPAAAVPCLAIALLAHPGLQTALDHYQFGEYRKACDQLQGIVGDARLDPGESRSALMYLGACRHVLGQPEEAAAAFDALLAEEPEARLDPVVFPPDMVAFFRTRKESRAAREPARPAAQAEASSQRREKSYLTAVLPFGAGQFQNERYGKGTVFASLQAVSLGVGVVGLVLFEAEKETGSFLGGGTFEDEDKAASLQSLYVASFAIFGGLWVVGAVDALIDFDEPVGVTFVPTPDGFVLGGSF